MFLNFIVCVDKIYHTRIRVLTLAIKYHQLLTIIQKVNVNLRVEIHIKTVEILYLYTYIYISRRQTSLPRLSIKTCKFCGTLFLNHLFTHPVPRERVVLTSAALTVGSYCWSLA